MAYHLFVSKCARVGGLGVIDSDSVDDEGVDIAGRLGSNHWRGLVVCRFDRRKRTIDEGRDCEVLDGLISKADMDWLPDRTEKRWA